MPETPGLDAASLLALEAGRFRVEEARDARALAAGLIRRAASPDAGFLLDANLYLRVPQPDGVPAYAVLLVAERLPSGYRGSVFGVLRLTPEQDEGRLAAAAEGYAIPSLRRERITAWAMPNVVAASA